MDKTNHHVAGLPEWATEEEAAEAVSALGLEAQQAEESAAKAEAAKLRHDWAMAARFYWASAYAALAARDFRLMRECARQASEADEIASPGGVLLAAIFGGCQRAAPDRPVAVGSKMPADQVAAARRAVQAEIARHSAAQKPTPKAAGRPAVKPLPADASEARKTALAAVQAGLDTSAAIKAAHGEIVVRAARAMVRDGHLIEVRGGRLSA